MKKLSEYKREEATMILGEIIDPAGVILGDGEIAKIVRGNENKMKAVKYALKKYPTEVLLIMAALNGVDTDDQKAFDKYADSVNIFTLPKMVMELLNDKDMIDFFTSLAPTAAQTPVGDSSEKA